MGAQVSSFFSLLSNMYCSSTRGIKVFAIVFEVQGWEFPAVIDEAMVAGVRFHQGKRILPGVQPVS